MAEVYHVAGWVQHHADGHRYWAEFGYYPTLDAAQRAAQSVAKLGGIISILVNGQPVATYQDGNLVTGDPPDCAQW